MEFSQSAHVIDSKVVTDVIYRPAVYGFLIAALWSAIDSAVRSLEPPIWPSNLTVGYAWFIPAWWIVTLRTTVSLSLGAGVL